MRIEENTVLMSYVPFEDGSVECLAVRGNQLCKLTFQTIRKLFPSPYDGPITHGSTPYGFSLLIPEKPYGPRHQKDLICTASIAIKHADGFYEISGRWIADTDGNIYNWITGENFRAPIAAGCKISCFHTTVGTETKYDEFLYKVTDNVGNERIDICHMRYTRVQSCNINNV